MRRGPEQMEAGQGAHHFLVFVQNRVAAVAAGEQGLLYIVQVVAEVEGDYALGVAQAHDGHRLVYEPGGLAGVQGGGDDAGVAGAVFQLRGYLRLADYQTGDLGLQRRLYHLRLVAADEYAVGGEHAPSEKLLGTAICTLPEMELEVSANSFTRFPSSTLIRLKRGSWSTWFS